jgi:hypothetical protein
VVDEIGKAFKQGLEEGMKKNTIEKTYESVDEHSYDEYTVEQTTKRGVVKQKDDCPLKIVITVDSKHIVSAIVDDINRQQYKRIRNETRFY